MVAITVILAAVIGTFVLGLGDSVESAPQAPIDFEIDDGNNNVDVTHRGGDTIVVDNLEFRIGGTAVTPTGDTTEFQVGQTISVNADEVDTFPSDANGETLDVIFSSSGSNTIIASFDIPEGSFSSA